MVRRPAPSRLEASSRLYSPWYASPFIAIAGIFVAAGASLDARGKRWRILVSECSIRFPPVGMDRIVHCIRN